MRRKLRIPSTAVAVLVCGGSCGDGDGGGGGSVGARLTAAAREVCDKLFRCDADYAEEEFGSEQECVDDYSGDYELDEEAEECVEAALDYLDCYAKISCDADAEEECAEEYDSFESACPEESEEADFVNLPSQAKARRAERALQRIRRR